MVFRPEAILNEKRDDVVDLYESYREFWYMSICTGNPGTGHGLSPLSQALHAQHLLQRVNDLDQIGLGRHHRVDVLVSAGCLVQDLRALVTLDALGCLLVVRNR